MSLPDVDILLATYIPEDMPEGLIYLNRQVQSLVDQDYAGNIRILVRDDGSHFDGIKALIQNREIPSHISFEFIDDDLGNLGYGKNFETLMEASTAPYVFFCDQDDSWASEKISKCVERLQDMERRYGSETPVLVNHDAMFCDRDLNVKNRSMNSAYGGRFTSKKMADFVSFTTTPGFTQCMNRALVEEFSPFIENYVGHDTYALMLARVLGEIGYIDEPLVSYRVHDKNTSSPRIKKSSPILDEVLRAGVLLRNISKTLKTYHEVRRNSFRKVKATEEFLERYADDPRLQKEDTSLMRNFCQTASMNGFQRLNAIKRDGFFANSWKAKLVFCLPFGQELADEQQFTCEKT
ncbi:MAG: glycosyltransferase [Bdellovibrionales bacterium]